MTELFFNPTMPECVLLCMCVCVVCVCACVVCVHVCACVLCVCVCVRVSCVCVCVCADRTCAVSSQDQCRNGTTLVSVGRHGRPECASGMLQILNMIHTIEIDHYVWEIERNRYRPLRMYSTHHYIRLCNTNLLS